MESYPRAGYIIASIVHELVHLIYYEKVTKSKCVWLEEGFAQYLSGQKSMLEMDQQRYKEWLRKNILEKEIPRIDFLKNHGSTYGKFCDLETNKYNGYDISYALVRYIIEEFTKEEINQIIRDKNKLIELEKNIIEIFSTELKKLI